jgi:hypothetical protein
MTGHEPIIELRMQGYAPRNVWVHVLDHEPCYFPGTHPRQSLQNGFQASIDIEPNESLILDFRCLTGLGVHLMGTNQSRVIRVLKLIEQVQPGYVIVSLPTRVIYPEFMANRVRSQ